MLNANPNQSHTSEQSALSPGVVLPISSVSDAAAPDGGLVSLLAKEGDQAATYSGNLLSSLESAVARIVRRGGYSADQLRQELNDLKDAHLVCYQRLIALRDAEQETFLALFNVANQILIRYAEVKQILRGVCCCCDFTPCQCPTTGEPDDAVNDVQREWVR